MGPKTAVSMLIGAILGNSCCLINFPLAPTALQCLFPQSAILLASTLSGFGILGPYARTQGWAPGPIGSWRTGATGYACISGARLTPSILHTWRTSPTLASKHTRVGAGLA